MNGTLILRFRLKWAISQPVTYVFPLSCPSYFLILVVMSCLFRISHRVVSASLKKKYCLLQMIKMTLNAEDPLRPSLHMGNLNTGGSFDITANGTRPLCRSSAEWIVERSYTISGLVGLLDFGTERFTDISYTVGGEVVDRIPEHVTVLDIINDELHDAVQTHTEVSEDYVEVTYLDV